MCRLLLDAGANLHAQDPMSGATAFIMAANKVMFLFLDGNTTDVFSLVPGTLLFCSDPGFSPLS